MVPVYEMERQLKKNLVRHMKKSHKIDSMKIWNHRSTVKHDCRNGRNVGCRMSFSFDVSFYLAFLKSLDRGIHFLNNYIVI